MEHSLFRFTADTEQKLSVSEIRNIFIDNIKHGTLESTLNRNEYFIISYLIEKSMLPEIKIVPDYKQIDATTYVAEFYYDIQNLIPLYNAEIDDALIPQIIDIFISIDEENLDYSSIAIKFVQTFHGTFIGYRKNLEEFIDISFNRLIDENPYLKKKLTEHRDKFVDVINNELGNCFDKALKCKCDNTIYHSYKEYVNPQIQREIAEHIDALRKLFTTYEVPEKILQEIMIQFNKKIASLSELE